MSATDVSPDVLQLRRRVMTKLVLFILLSATAAPSVQAGDAKDSQQDVMEFCNQFVIRDPDPGIRLDHHLDCHMDDRDNNRCALWR
jgi:hypothetical protein